MHTILDLQDFMNSEYYNGNSVYYEHPNGQFYLTFFLPRAQLNFYLYNNRYAVLIEDELFNKKWSGYKRSYPNHTLYVCLGEGYEMYKKEYTRISKAGGYLLNTAMILNSIVGIGYHIVGTNYF